MSMQPFSDPSPQAGGNYTGPDDGNFKRGAMKPVAIVIGILILFVAQWQNNRPKGS